MLNEKTCFLAENDLKEFYEIGKSLSSERDTLKLMEKIINSSMKLTSSDAGTVYLIIDTRTGNLCTISNNNPCNKLLKFAITKNMSIDISFKESTSEIIENSISGYTAITGKALRIDDAYKIGSTEDYRHDSSFDTNTGYITKSILSIPMKDHENKILGVIQLLNKKKSYNQKIDYNNISSINSIIPYGDIDELIMNSLAGQAAVALENNFLYRDMQNLIENYREQNTHLSFLSKKILVAHEEERKRIAREIHDGPAQLASSMVMKLDICKKYFQLRNFDKLSEEIDRLSSGIRETLKEIRTIIYDLKPSYLEDGLIAALKNHISIFEENTQIRITLKVVGEDLNVEYYLTSTIYRMVQEALSNVAKHANAKNVLLDLNISKTSIIVEVSDDGKGFDVSALSLKKHSRLEGGFGLEGIMERVELIKGDILIDSENGKGTIIKIIIPL